MSDQSTIEADAASNKSAGKGLSVQRLVRRAVFSARNSECPSARIEDLDPEQGWWTDDGWNTHYLHVWHKDGETVHRVYCRKCDKPRLLMKRGKLMWIYSPNAD